MAAEDKKISGLTDATLPLNDADLVEVVQGGVNKKAPKSAFGGGAVDSVNGETGVVVLSAADVGADPAGSASTVNTALSNHISDATDAHAGTAITNTPAGNISATTAQGAINELDTEKASITYVDAQVATKYDFLVSLRTLTASHTLDSTDLASVNAGDQLVIRMNVAVSNNMEIPLNATVAFPIGTLIGVRNINIGVTTITAAIGVTLNSPLSAFKLSNQYDMCYIEKVGTNEWVANGQLSL